MPLYRDEAVVLRTHKLGEADRIVTMLSREHGKIRAVAKGVRRTASKFGARLEPFMVADVQLFEGRTLDIITQAETLGAYGGAIASDYSSYTAATAMVETADKVTDDDGSLQQYLLLVGALRSLSRGEHEPSLTLDSYLLRSLSIAGWAPSFVDCAVTGAPGPHSVFVVQMGGVVADAVAPPGAPRLDQATLGLLSSLLAGDWEAADATAERTRNQASGVVAAYTQFHLERGLRSLRHVDRTPGTRALTAASSAPPTTIRPLRTAPEAHTPPADGSAPTYRATSTVPTARTDREPPTAPTAPAAGTAPTARTDREPPTAPTAPAAGTAPTAPADDSAPDAPDAPPAPTQAGATS